MIFSVKTLVSYISQFMSLQPGDIISTGTPAGIGMAIKPDPIFLVPAQTIRLGVQGLGEQVRVTQAAR
jgi:ureidoglycolate lyase